MAKKNFYKSYIFTGPFFSLSWSDLSKIAGGKSQILANIRQLITAATLPGVISLELPMEKQLN